MKLLIIIAVIFACYFQTTANKISCNKLGDDNFFGQSSYLKTCFIANNTKISSTETTIDKKDETVLGLRLTENRNVFFLPIKVNRKFPNLLNYNGYDCSVGSISKANFEGLTKLELLLLSENEIEKIPSNAFEELISLKKVWLDSNRIKNLNGAAFENLRKLEFLSLNLNECMYVMFQKPTKLATMQNFLDERCGYQEAGIINKILVDEFNKTRQNLLNKFENFKANINAELSNKEAEINELKERLVEVSDSSITIKYIEDYSKVYEDLLAKMTEISELKVKLLKSEAQNLVNTKELETLKEENQRKSLEIIVKTMWIKECKESKEEFMESVNDRVRAF